MFEACWVGYDLVGCSDLMLRRAGILLLLLLLLLVKGVIEQQLQHAVSGSDPASMRRAHA